MSCLSCTCCGKRCSFKLCSKSREEALGLPKRTVRAVIAMVVIFSTLILTATVLIFLCVNEKWDIAIGVLGAILSIATGVLGYYFGFRSGSNSQNSSLENFTSS